MSDVPGTAPPLTELLDRPGPAAQIAFVGATVIDGTGAAPIPDATVLVSARRVERVIGAHETTRLGADYEQVDVRGRYLMPGLFDCHVHLTGEVTNDPSKRYLEAFPPVRAIR